MAGNDAHKTAGGGYSAATPRRNMPYNPYAMAAAGLAVVGGLWYLYGRNKPEGGRHTDDTRRHK